MERKHLMDAIRFAKDAKEADERIVRYTGLATVQEKTAFLKGMFDCLDNVNVSSSVEECYQKYLEHIIAVNNVEEIISITHEFRVSVCYKKTNRHGTSIFTVSLKLPHYYMEFGTFYLNSKDNVVKFTPLVGNFLMKELMEEVKKVYTVERLQRVAKLAQ